MNDKERMKYYLIRLEELGKCFADFFESECPTAPPSAVRLLLDAYRDIACELTCIANELPNE